MTEAKQRIRGQVGKINKRCSLLKWGPDFASFKSILGTRIRLALSGDGNNGILRTLNV